MRTRGGYGNLGFEDLLAALVTDHTLIVDQGILRRGKILSGPRALKNQLHLNNTHCLAEPAGCRFLRLHLVGFIRK
jgi:hypothetical protein